jgi:hypothetical protein
MKSSIRAALAVGALALASSQVLASTVNVNYSMSPVSVTTSNSPFPNNDPASYGLIVGNSGNGFVNTSFQLIDTIPDSKVVTYNIFADGDNTLAGYTAIGPSLFSWVFTDLMNNSPNNIVQALAANTQYVLQISTNGALASETQISAVPLPAAAWLFGSALLGFGAMRRKQKAGNSEMAVA